MDVARPAALTLRHAGYSIPHIAQRRDLGHHPNGVMTDQEVAALAEYVDVAHEAFLTARHTGTRSPEGSKENL
jgi:hypothetical protein